jgi:hypothetical protein
MSKPYYADDGVTLHHGDALNVLGSMPDQSVDCIVTSPPYLGLRDYGVTGTTGMVAARHGHRYVGIDASEDYLGRMTTRTCATPGCERPAVARGMCNAHYARARREGRKTEPPVECIRRPTATYTSCRCETCRPERNRMRKLTEAGLVPPTRDAEARAVTAGMG